MMENFSLKLHINSKDTLFSLLTPPKIVLLHNGHFYEILLTRDDHIWINF